MFKAKTKLLGMKKLVILLLLTGITGYSQPHRTIDSLEKALKVTQGHDKTEILSRLSELYQSVDIEKSIAYDLQNLELQRRFENVKDQSTVLNNLGISYYMLGDYAASLNYFEQSLELRETAGDTLNIVKTLNNLGVISQIAGDFDQALEYLQQSLIFKIELDDTLSTAKTLNNIGVIYKDAGKYDMSQRFLNQALDNYLAVNDSSGIAAVYNNLGQVYEAEEKPDSALRYFSNSLEIKRKIGDKRGIANTLNNIGLIYANAGNPEKAKTYFNEAIGIREKINDQFGLASAMNNLANVHLNERNFTAAKNLFKKSLQIANAENLKGIMQRNYAGFSRLYEMTGIYDSSLFYFKKFTVVKDSIFSDDLNKQLATLEVKYETEKSKKENEILRQQNRIQELQIENSRRQKIQFVGVIFLLFFGSIIVVLYLQYRNNKRHSEELKDLNNQLEARVKERTAKLEEVNATKDRFFSIIAHDLKSPFNSLLGFAEILNNDYNSLGDFKRKEISGYLKESAETVYRLLENLLEWSSTQTGRLKLRPRMVDLKALAKDTLKLAKPLAENKQIDLKLKASEPVHAMVDGDSIRTVLRNLVSNAIKFTPRGGSVDVSVSCSENSPGKKTARIKVRDNGTGIREENLKGLFDLAKNKPSAGTDNEPGTGLGLPLSRDFTELNGGTIRIESTWGEGSTFTVELPAEN